MKKQKKILDGRFTSSPVSSVCPCGKPVHYLLRKRIRLIPSGHKCKYRDMQRDVVRTIRAEESAGIHITQGEAERRINEVLRSKDNAQQEDRAIPIR